jgi:predicted Zn-dependent peptidase
MGHHRRDRAREEWKVFVVLFAIALAVTAAALFIAVTDRGKPGPRPANERDWVYRVLEAILSGSGSSSMSDAELREKARQYLQ